MLTKEANHVGVFLSNYRQNLLKQTLRSPSLFIAITTISRLSNFRMSSVPNAMDSMAWALSTIVIFGSICVQTTMILEGFELCYSTKLLGVDCVFFLGRVPSTIGET
jgi:hypothetical protein